MTITDDLHEYLLAAGPELDTDEARSGFRIDNDGLAGWALRKHADALRRASMIDAQVQTEVDRVQEWGLRSRSAPVGDAAFFEAALIDYYRRLQGDDPEFPNTYKLPQGNIKRAKNPDRVTVTDEAQFVAWAETHAPDAVARKPLVSVLKGTGFRRVIDKAEGLAGHVVDAETGEVVPGVAAVQGGTRYEVRPASDLDGLF